MLPSRRGRVGCTSFRRKSVESSRAGTRTVRGAAGAPAHLARRLPARARGRRGGARRPGLHPGRVPRSSRAPQRVAGALGQPLDLAGQRGALGRYRRAARGPLHPLRLPRPTGAGPARRPARRAAAAGRRPRRSCSSTARPGSPRRLVQQVSGSIDPPWRLQGAGAILLVHAYSMYVYFYLFVRAGLRGSTRRRSRRPRPRRRALADLHPRGPSAAPARARRGGAAHLHHVARLVQRALHLRRRLPGHDDADRLHPPQRRRPAGDGGDAGAHGCCARRPRAGAPGRRRGAHRRFERGTARGPADRLAARARALSAVAWLLAVSCCCRTRRCCWYRSSRSAPGPPSRCPPPTRWATTRRS